MTTARSVRSTTRSSFLNPISTRSSAGSGTAWLPYWADPGKHRPDEFNTNDGGRGVYWEDPSGHFLEIITRPYGSGT